MRRKYNLILRSISLVLAVGFGLQEASYAAPLTGPGVAPETVLQDPTRLEVPVDFSSLKEAHKGSQDTLIIHIQDAHSNLSGQQNLAGTLDYLMSKYGVSLVLVEGSSKEGTLTPLKRAVSPAVCKRLAKSLLMEGQLAGEEYLNLTSDRPMKIMGVENKSLYFQSLENYALLADKREEILLYLRSIQGGLDKLKTKLYPKELLDYEKNTKEIETDFKALFELAQANNADLSDFPNIQKLIGLQKRERQINFEEANLEQAALVEEIQKRGAGDDLQNYLRKTSQAKNTKASQLAFFENTFSAARGKNIPLKPYPALIAYGDYLKEFSGIDLDQALDEFSKAEDRVYVSALPDKDTRLIRAIDRYVKLLDTAYRIQMTTKEFRLFEANEPDFSTVAYLAFINRKLMELGYFEDLISYKGLLEEGKKALRGFYDSVDKRDLAFIQNTERILKKEKQKVAVLISGGYHTAHLKELFREKGYSYAVLSPLVTSQTNQQKYEKLLLGPIRKEVKTVEAIQMRSRSDESLGALEKDFASLKKKEGVRYLGAIMRLDGSEGPVQRILEGAPPALARAIRDELTNRPDNSDAIGVGRVGARLSTKLEVVQGDIIRVPADAVVAGVNTQMYVGVGLTGAVIRAVGGRDLAFPNESERGTYKLGTAIPKSVQQTKNPANWKYVISAVMHAFEPLHDPSEQSVKSATINSLKAADDLNLSSVTLPAFGTSNLGTSSQDAARWMISAAEETVASGQLRHLKTITFVLFDAETYSVFKQVLGAPARPAGGRLAEVSGLSSRELRKRLVKLALQGNIAGAQQVLDEWVLTPGNSLEKLAQELGHKRDVIGILHGDLIVGEHGAHHSKDMSKKYGEIGFAKPSFPNLVAMAFGLENYKNRTVNIPYESGGVALFRPQKGDTVIVLGKLVRQRSKLFGARLAQTQEEIQSRIAQNSPAQFQFIKDAPILGYRITSDRFGDLPDAIRRHIGAVDQTKYTREYLRANIGSIIALQMKDDTTPDFYVIGKDTFDNEYRAATVADVSTKNKKTFDRLSGVEGMKALIDANDQNLVGALKTAPVSMIKMSDIGYPVTDEVTIQSPWGEQTKPAGQDAYLTFDQGANQYYMVNSDAEGLPLSYVVAQGPRLSTKLEVVQGDITRVPADAVVAGVNTQMYVGVGLTGAVIRAVGGRDQAFPSESERGQYKLGDAIPKSVQQTRNPANWKYVISAVMHAFEPLHDPSEQSVKSATINSLKAADDLNLSSVTLPAFGTGNLGTSSRDAARWMISAAEETVASGQLRHLKTITFVLFDAETYSVFKQVLGAPARPAGGRLAGISRRDLLVGGASLAAGTVLGRLSSGIGSEVLQETPSAKVISRTISLPLTSQTSFGESLRRSDGSFTLPDIAGEFYQVVQPLLDIEPGTKFEIRVENPVPGIPLEFRLDTIESSGVMTVVGKTFLTSNGEAVFQFKGKRTVRGISIVSKDPRAKAMKVLSINITFPSGARLADEAQSPSLLRVNGVEGLLPETVVTTKAEIEAAMDLLLLVIAGNKGIVPIGTTETKFVAINVLPAVKGITTVRLVDPRALNAQGGPQVFATFEVTKEQILEAKNRYTAAPSLEARIPEQGNREAVGAVRDYQAQNSITRILLTQMAKGLAEDKFVMLSIGIHGQDASEMIKQMQELQTELAGLRATSSNRLNVFFELVDENGDRIETFQGFQSETIPQDLAGEKVERLYSGVLSDALVNKAKAIKAGLLATQEARIDENTYNVIPYKPDMRAGIMAAVADAQDESVRRALRTLTQAEIGVEEVKLVKEVPDYATAETYRQKNLIVKALAALSQKFYQAYVTLRAVGTSA